MKLLIPNAKELNTNLEAQSFQELSPASQAVLKSLCALSEEELATFYQIKLEKAQLEADRWYRLAHKQAKTYPAWQLYDGLMYRYMKRRDLSAKEQTYLASHAYITTGFYGLINVLEPISPHRLDFQGSLKVNGQSLKQFWRSQYDALVADEELIISFLSSEFEAVFSPEIQQRMIKLTFMEEKAGKCKVHSTISKKGRGRFVSLMAEKNVQTVAEIKTLSADGFVYRQDLSDEHNLVFVRPATN